MRTKIILLLLSFTLLLSSLPGCAMLPTSTPTPSLPPEPTHTPTDQQTTLPATLSLYPEPPAWARGAVIYQLFIRAFTLEGTFKAATARLPELREMGVDIIQLLPIHPTGTEKRIGSLGSPYSIRDYRAIDPALGSEDDFRQFIETAHTLGMYVIMDFVANHTAWDNPLLTEHPDWYTQNAAGEIVPPRPDWLDVADLNYTSDALRAYMLETSLYWVNTFGIDGYRCDASDLVPNDFWTEWRTTLLATRPDLLLLSESDGLALYRAGFEVAYDWGTRDKFIQALKNPKLAIAILPPIARELTQTGVWRLRYLENHDHDRIAQVAATPAQRELSAVFLLTLPGLPLIYNGQEVGLTQRPSLFDISKLNWRLGTDDLRTVYTTLIHLRRESPALREGTLEILKLSIPSVVAYTRATATQRVLILLNFAAQPAQITLPDLITGTDLLSREAVDLSAGIQLNGDDYRIIEIP
ncbi:MAG: alpha-glucosidase C-terminal domain-containing protein [Anaerolineales bacterium]|nr:alpha-glucosidase C-terminal domain-containing protein [Anaerolineales bacterium]